MIACASITFPPRLMARSSASPNRRVHSPRAMRIGRAHPRAEYRYCNSRADPRPERLWQLRQWNGPKNAAEAIWQRYGKGDMA
jgi:hypothetical protein